MEGWEEWEGVEEWTKEDSEITIMPCLCELRIFNCKLLKALPDFVFKTPLQTLCIAGSEKLLESYQEGNGEWAKISSTIPKIRIIRYRKQNLEINQSINVVVNLVLYDKVKSALRPHPDSESLWIYNHNGTTWPNWIQSLHNLRFLIVSSSTHCELWPLGKLEYLERLTLWNMLKVRKVGVEFLGLEDQTSFRIRSPPLILFPKLKQLYFAHMWGWEEWEGVEEWTKEDSEITIMPRLSELTIRGSNSLKALPDFLFKTPLQTLEIYGSPRLLERYQEGNGERAKISATIPNICIIKDSIEASREDPITS
ncbi:uncharacterized protein LOC110771212 [Prunus avium]|uniref:Uncharacterized protein LOC110771212 n=1 Tax=Prunus avium TaxID=42229 RepID=A0A6P5TTT0_PRUAV|nr:uncharacterized protein LOC110771212 [Prunus avium]